MKLLSIILSVFLLISLGLKAQSLEIREAPAYVQFDAQVPFVETGLTVYNTSDSAIAVVAERIDNQLRGAQYSFFCWDVCYGAAVNRSIGAIQIRPDKATDAFTLTFHPEGDNSPVAVTMRFFNRDNPDDYIDHTFHFGTSVTALTPDVVAVPSLGQPYPNPAREIAQLDYQLPPGTQGAQITLFNLIGKQVARLSLSELQGTARIALQDYPPGIYMLSLVIDGQRIASRRLVVR